MPQCLKAVTLAAVTLAAALAGATALAQQDKSLPPRAEAIIYRDAGYQGPAVNVQVANPSLGLVWPVNSIRVRSGHWQLCERPNYQGRCRTFTADTAVLLMGRGETVQSIRPLDLAIQPVPNRHGPSLKGMAAEFYTTPMQRGQRVLACPRGAASAQCAATSADQFCRSAGWTGSAREAMQTVNRRVYLADVLCSRTGH